MKPTGYSPARVRLDVCCNDPDNGLFAGRAAMIHCEDGLLELEANDFHGPAFREVDGGIRLSRRTFPILSGKDWYGNWCWNAYWLDVDVAVALLDYVHGLDCFDPSLGESRIFEMWRWRERFGQSDREFIARSLVKSSIAKPGAAL